MGQNRKIFPTPDSKNLVICVPGISGTKGFSPLISDCMPDLHVNGDSQCYPLYWYSEPSDNDLFEDGSWVRHDGVTEYILEKAKSQYGNVTKEDIFYYVYGIFHSREYATKYASDLKKLLPRLPLVRDAMKFRAFSKAGRELAALHLNYEDVPPCPGVTVEGDRGSYHVTKMRYLSKGRVDTILYNESITVKNIPEIAQEYVVNGKPAIDWVLENYQVKVDSDSGIKDDPNDWATEHNKPRYILDLLLSIINMSVKSVEIINSLPSVDWDSE